MTGFPIEDLWVGIKWRCLEELSAKRESVGTKAVGEKAKIAKLGKTLRKDVDEKAADKLVVIQRHGFFAVAVFAVLVLESNVAVLEGQEAVV